MSQTAQRSKPTLRTGSFAGVVALLGLASCALHDATSLKRAISQWFFLGDVLHFESKLRCTAAVFRATENRVKPGVVERTTLDEAQSDYRQQRFAVARDDAQTPHQMTDTMVVTEDGAFGRQALAAAAMVGPCLSDNISLGFRKALTQPGATLAYSETLGGVMVLDPVERKLYFAAGDTF